MDVPVPSGQSTAGSGYELPNGGFKKYFANSILDVSSSNQLFLFSLHRHKFSIVRTNDTYLRVVIDREMPRQLDD